MTAANTTTRAGRGCSTGWAARCSHGKGRRCRCACGGENHGRNNPASAAHTKPRQTNMFDKLDIRHDRRQMEYQLGEPPTRAAAIPFDDTRVIFFSRPVSDSADAHILIGRPGQSLRPLEQRLVYHSPTGLEFGYAGSGPADTALNILALVLEPREATRLHQAFKFDHVTNVPREGGQLAMADVCDWIRARYLLETSDPAKMADEGEGRRLYADIVEADRLAALEDGTGTNGG